MRDQNRFCPDVNGPCFWNGFYYNCWECPLLQDLAEYFDAVAADTVSNS